MAKELLSRSDLSITEISYRCGFTDSAYMGKQFRKVCGMTPKEYRQGKKYEAENGGFNPCNQSKPLENPEA